MPMEKSHVTFSKNLPLKAPLAPSAASAFGCLAGTAEEVEDLLAPLPEEEWEVLT
jgi:hypothetical protein